MASVVRTAMEEDYGHAFSDEEWETVDHLNKIADGLADHCCSEINRLAALESREPVKYNEQWTLEKLIRILQGRV